MASSTYRKNSLSNSEVVFGFGVWKVGTILSSKVRQQEDPQGGSTYERHEVYETTRIDRPSKRPDVIKVKKQSTPKLLGYAVETQIDSDELPGGYIAYIVMQKVPGENLHGFDRLPKEEQNRIRVAVIHALCFIVDLEDAEQHTNRTKDDVCLDAFEQLEYWGLIEGQYEGTLFFEKDKLLDDLKARLYSQ
ncbi:hypothetical protein ASPBRDRAFT_68931 [Aspergillus brasiliensis CBS 101740]|uniref:Uncharacterized protein n=1 Tax=Aspergillus brasiliensis (strain CBS 101740 / IMI 381727 / IBT 21946) TaxID=767769 RepID=A0A1L9U7V4_ASPBC|nr:hypothetical protein ASPBRDRAFT_68931 [Aspergillus brasiliensis CBS 101740]